MTKKLTIMLVLLLILTGYIVAADDMTVNCAIDNSTNMMTISGEVNTSASWVSCHVQDPNNRVVYIGDVDVIDGTYNISFIIEHVVSGNYTVTIKLRV